MQTSVNPDKVEELSFIYKNFGTSLENNEKELYRYLKNMLNDIKREYSERVVRKEVEEMERLLESIRKDAEEISCWYKENGRTLKNTSEQIRYEEQQLQALFNNQRFNHTGRYSAIGGRYGFLGTIPYRNAFDNRRSNLYQSLSNTKLDQTLLQYIYLTEMLKEKEEGKTMDVLRLISKVEVKALQEQSRLNGLTEMEYNSEMDRMRQEIENWLGEEKGGKWRRSIHVNEIKGANNLNALVGQGRAYVDLSGAIYFNHTVTEEEKRSVFTGSLNHQLALDIEKANIKDNKWQEILSKEGSAITNEEYRALASIFTTLEDEAMETFINMCFENVHQHHIGYWFGEDLEKYIRYHWEVDALKYQKLNEAMDILLEENYLEGLTLSEEYDRIDNEQIKQELLEKIKNLQRERLDLIQRTALINSLPQLGEVTSRIENPEIKLNSIERNKEERGYQDIVLTHINWVAAGFIARTEIDEEKYTQEMSISRTLAGSGIMRELNEKEKEALRRKLNLSDEKEISDKAIDNAAKEYVINKLLDTDKKAVEVGLENVPILGEAQKVYGAIIDFVEDSTEYRDGLLNDYRRINDDEMTTLANEFRMFGVIIDNQYSPEDSYVYLKPSYNTDTVINNYNYYLGDKSSYTSELEMSEQTYEMLKGEIDISTILSNTKEIHEKMDKIIDYPLYIDVTDYSRRK
ncbi:hypothetical protein EDC19_2422 [Natranaerovirga hydrolytica]|uniref:Uncharacterized protein n=1 Tax=Natranaerovirga hydrolytica TaxID=680378 RepID=A0A4R1MLE7_9FIRM|nr:hypothetical protein [Natranaerovirga hydrolytica]TCK90653.1 hypothetical protein EDC19_2422 [Natranaerovirga hydrolytica]